MTTCLVWKLTKCVHSMEARQGTEQGKHGRKEATEKDRTRERVRGTKMSELSISAFQGEETHP